MKTGRKISKAGCIVSIILNLLLTALYVVFVYASLGLFAGVPWYNDNLMLFNYALWIPVCIVTVAVVITSFATKLCGRFKLAVLCLNALYIPFEVILNTAKSTMTLIAIVSFVTIFIYVIIFIKELAGVYVPGLKGNKNGK